MIEVNQFDKNKINTSKSEEKPEKIEEKMDKNEVNSKRWKYNLKKRENEENKKQEADEQSLEKIKENKFIDQQKINILHKTEKAGEKSKLGNIENEIFERKMINIDKNKKFEKENAKIEIERKQDIKKEKNNIQIKKQDMLSAEIFPHQAPCRKRSEPKKKSPGSAVSGACRGLAALWDMRERPALKPGSRRRFPRSLLPPDGWPSGQRSFPWERRSSGRWPG